MRILIEIGHPAHVHFFRRAIARLQRSGHRLVVLTRNKDITNQLLDEMGITYHCLSRPARGKWRMGMELLWRWLATTYYLLRYRIDRAVSISGITTGLPARLCGVPNAVFTDTEDANLSNYIAFPFATRIYTPEFFLKDLGSKQQRYAGLHELAYLQHFDFAAAALRRMKLGLPPRYFIIRLIANDALHDSDIQGIRVADVERLIQHLSSHGRVYVTSEGAPHPRLAPYRLQTPLVDIHAVLEGATLFIGESPTMAVESSLLGTPAFLLSQRCQRLGNMVGLEERHRLLRNFGTFGELEAALRQVGDFEQAKADWRYRAVHFRTGSCDMDELITQVMTGESQERAACVA